MLATLITEENKDEFLRAVPDKIREKCDLFIGAVDEESDTACGVIASELFQEGSIIIRHIYVDENYRDKGAGRAMITLLMDVAKNADVMSAYAHVTVLYEEEDEDDMNAVRVLLDGCGFDEMSLGRIFSMKMSDIKQAKRRKGPLVFPLGTVGENEWNKLMNLDAYAEDRDEYSADYSILSFDKKRDCDGAVLVKDIGEVPMIDQIITVKDEETDMKEVLVDCAIGEMKQKLNEEDKIYVFIGDRSLEKTFWDYSDGNLKLEGELYIEYTDIF